MVSYVTDFVLVQQEPSHSQALDRENTHFYKHNGIERLAFNFKVIHYKTLMYLVNISLGFFGDAATPNLTPIKDNRSD